jgi:hypothetical protein
MELKSWFQTIQRQMMNENHMINSLMNIHVKQNIDKLSPMIHKQKKDWFTCMQRMLHCLILEKSFKVIYLLSPLEDKHNKITSTVSGNIFINLKNLWKQKRTLENYIVSSLIILNFRRIMF